MPNRLIREGILTSDRVNALKPVAEVFYRRLMSVVDDWGRFSADPRLLRAHCYPLKIDAVREADIARSLAEVQGAGLIALYAVDGKPYLELLDFRQQVRAKASKYPAPPATDTHHPPDTGTTDAQQTQSTCAAPAKHVPSACAASAHLDGDGDGDDRNPRELKLSTPEGGGGVPGSKRAARRNPTVAQSPPTREAWRAYAATLSPPMPAPDADGSYDHYVAVGWVIGKARTPMRDWQAAVRTCHRIWQQGSGASARPAPPASSSRPPSVWEIKQRLEAMDGEIRELESRSPGPHCSLSDFLSPAQLERLRALRSDRQGLRQTLANRSSEGAA
jgi:hypothetical protein